MPAEVAARHLLEHDKVTISRSIANFIHDSLQPGTNEVKVVFSDLGSISVSVEEISAGTAGDVRTGVWRRTKAGRWNYWYGTDGWEEDMTLTALRSFTTV